MRGLQAAFQLSLDQPVQGGEAETMPIALYALAVGGFGIGLTEFVIAGLLPEVAADFGVSESVAGYLISGYALSVAAGAIALTAALVPANRKAAAISVMFTGLTVANVLGVPLGTFLGQAAGWRATFWAISVIGVISFIGIAVLIPSIMKKPEKPDFAIFRSRQVWLSMIITVLGFGGMFGAFSFIAYALTQVSGFSVANVPWLLVLFGVGLFAGNIAGGKAADLNPGRTLAVLLAGLTVVLAVFATVAGSQIATVVALVLMGGFGFATVPGLQMRIMTHAQASPTLASGANIAAFNVGNAFGAWIGGLTLAAGLGYTAPLWAGAAVTLAGLIVFGIAAVLPHGEFTRAKTLVTG
ncbi:MFS transporter [Actinoplanes sp. CA-015351]|uniref:MFS transporter n=1 Tax=Actinoplanes sp. CA-015351 TaxID=3239897 RepID=UPI003D96EAB9